MEGSEAVQPSDYSNRRKQRTDSIMVDKCEELDQLIAASGAAIVRAYQPISQNVKLFTQRKVRHIVCGLQEQTAAQQQLLVTESNTKYVALRPCAMDDALVAR